MLVLVPLQHKMKFSLLSLTVTLLFFQFRISSAQDSLKHCCTDEFMKSVYQKNPFAQYNRQQLELFTQQYHANNNTRQIYVIPVVFHIIHNYGSENISDAQVRDAVKILNEDYSRMNSDTADIVNTFKPIAANIGFEFRLATIAPNGNCTNGIEHIQSNTTYGGGEQSKLNPWPREKYLNIWVTRELASGAAGYTYLPGTASADADGIMILSTYVGSTGTGNYQTARALTHEIGHWFNLLHPWGNSNSPGVSCGDDNVNDTPETKGWTTCNLNGASCGSTLDNVQNYMEYAYCSRMFTSGQKTRMLAAINSSVAGRNNLWSNSNLIATGTVTPNTTVTCIPVADFIGSSVNVCVGGSIQLSDVSWNAKVIYRFWNISGANASSLTDSVISISFNTPGIYSVSLTAGNNSGSDEITKTAFIQVISDTDLHAHSYAENFEDNSFPDSDFQPENSNDINWYLASPIGYDGSSHCLALHNFSSPGNETYGVDGPSFDLSTFANPNLTFHVAYAQKTAVNNDKLRVMISLNCGQNWFPRYSKSGSQLATSPLQTSNFFPDATEWRMETVNLSLYAASTNLRIKFEVISNGGNNIFIDDINLGGYSSTENLLTDNSIQISPNPALTGVTVTGNSLIGNTISIYDLLGRNIFSEIPTANTETINLNSISSGIYFIEIKSSTEKKTFRFVKM